MKIGEKEFVTYLSEATIQQRIKELADRINSDYKERNPLFIAILNGSFMFAADLLKKLEGAVEISFIKVASYEQLSSTGYVKNLIGLSEPLHNRDVVILEDIIDTGLTMEKVLEMIKDLGPGSIEIVTLLQKPEALKVDLDIKYCGFEIPNKFVVGYGLDYDGLGRNFKEILQVKD
jgi:hypoxanthine phosphoribosyltransferase